MDRRFHGRMEGEDLKRFTETLKWSDPWFRKLPPESKHLWLWLLDNCDAAGVIDPDFDLATFQIGYPMGIDTLKSLDNRVVSLPCGKLFIVKFIQFQYGEKLSTDCKAHNPVFASLSKHGIKDYPKSIHTPQDKVKEIDSVKDTIKESGSKFKKPSIEEVKLHCSKAGISMTDAEWFFYKCEGNGWTNAGRPMKSWQMTLISWKTAGYLPSQKNHANNSKPNPRNAGVVGDLAENARRTAEFVARQQPKPAQTHE